MSQVLRVNRFTGEFVYLDKDGQTINRHLYTTVMDRDDADVLIERIRQGYQYISAGCYVIRLEHFGPNAGNGEFTELVTFELDDDGYHVPKYTLLVTNESFRHPASNHAKILTSNAFIDYNHQFLAWMDNPLAADPFVKDPARAVQICDVDDEAAILLEVGGRYLMRDKPSFVEMIPTRFYVE